MNAIQMAAKIYDMRDILKTFDGDRYLELEGPYIGAIRNVMDSDKCNSIQAAMKVAEKLEKEGFNGFTIMRCMAASLEVEK